MDPSEGAKTKDKEHPEVPIKTYEWEDVRRSRLKGAYPWTHLTKEPFAEKIDREQYTMDAWRKCRSVTPMGRKLEESGKGKSLEHLRTFSFTPIDHSIHQIQTSVEDDIELNLEEAESSDNISQYLDKDEPCQESYINVESNTTSALSNGEKTILNDRNQRAKSEELPKKKRKLSIDSSYSRKSLSKLGFLKRIRQSLSRSNSKKQNKNQQISKQKKEKKEKTETSKDSKISKPPLPKPSQNPVYIHIPLKPPEGETDEFSYLEFEEKRPEIEKESNNQLTVEQSEERSITPIRTPLITPVISKNPTPEMQDRRFSTESNEIVAIEILKSEDLDQKSVHELGLNGPHSSGDIFIIQNNSENPTSDDVAIIILGSDEEPLPSNKLQSKPPSVRSKRSNSGKVRSKSAEPERKRKLSIDSSYSRKSLSKLAWLNKKLKEGKDKFKLPTFSSLRKPSKKKPLNEKEKEKVKEKEKDKEKEKIKEKEKEKKIDEPLKIVEDPKKKTKSESIEPKYIHIPLKPPPGETDEFSHLEFEEKSTPLPSSVKKEDSKDEQSSIDSPDVVAGSDVQFIFLTPPSDDEILDQPEVPETPSSESSKCFNIEELKNIAKDAVDEVSPKSQRKILEPVTEENCNDRSQTPSKEPTPEKDNKDSKMIIDEEDGLKSSQPVKEESNNNKEETKFEIKKDESPLLKKKVSFKRRSRDESVKDTEYEDIEPIIEIKPKENIIIVDEEKEKMSTRIDNKIIVVEEKKETVSVLGSSTFIEDEKPFLDPNKMKDTSLEENFNKWSKLSDHEYEPINPPPEDAFPKPLASNMKPSVHVIDIDQNQTLVNVINTTTKTKDALYANEEKSDTSYIAQELQPNIENRFFNKTPADKTSSSIAMKPTSFEKSNVDASSPSAIEEEKKNVEPSKFQKAVKTQAGKLKEKFHSIKKPNIHLPSKPNLARFKIEKPKINLPKMPDRKRLSLPSFSLPRKNNAKRTMKQRQLSTESNAGDSKKSYFDFSTYPRIFKRKTKTVDDFDLTVESKNELKAVEFATVPRRNKQATKDSAQVKETDKREGRDSIRISLHADDSIEDKGNEEKSSEPEQRENSIERRMASHIRYDDEIDIDDAFDKENQEIHNVSPFSNNYNSRWDHGSFHPEANLNRTFLENLKNREYKVTDLDSPEDEIIPQEVFQNNIIKDIHSSESSLGVHRQGVLEEIDSDEFFLRQKGISQDNIEVGMYLSTEIREAFKSPTNALSGIQRDPNNEYPLRASNQSLPETQQKRKAIKKPKRKKTPHVSQEKLTCEQDDSEQEEFSGNLPPARPKRRSKKNKSPTDNQDIEPFSQVLRSKEVYKENLGILGKSDDECMYENRRMEGKDQPEIIVDTCKSRNMENSEQFHPPNLPPRGNKISRSLTSSEHDLIFESFNFNRNFQSQNATRNASAIHRRPSSPSTYLQYASSEEPIRPARSRTRSLSRTTSNVDQNDECIVPTNVSQQPCIEEPCKQIICDYMGYAIVDKDKKREPPLPPPRTPPRRKRSFNSSKSSASEQKFSTVPRQLNEHKPTRPTRNYSTLGPSRPPRRKFVSNMTDEEKENVDIIQYIEIEDEPNRDLHSGEVVQKMKDRPLPAPPRPPRKTRPFTDLTSEENIPKACIDEIDNNEKFVEETVSTQTEPLPEDFICEEVRQESTDKILSPSKKDDVVIERRLTTPTQYTHEETITHASLIVEPLNGVKILPDSQLIKKTTERIIPVAREEDWEDEDDDETSEIPEEFKNLKTPQKEEKNPEKESELVRIHKLQVTDLDVDRLSVNELLANRIVVSEIDSGVVQTNEISSRTGAIKVGEIELPPNLIKELFDRLQSSSQEQSSGLKDDDVDDGQKKTSFETKYSTQLKEPCERMTSFSIPTHPLDESPQLEQADSVNVVVEEEVGQAPVPPVRSDSSSIQIEHPKPPRQEQITEIEHPEVDDEPPPRPPQPIDLFLPSQPPASFYALRAQHYVDNLEGDIPVAPRRRRHHKQQQRPSHSSSSEEDSAAAAAGASSAHQRRRIRSSSEQSIPHLTGQLVQACGLAANNSIKRLINHITNNVLRNTDGKQDLHVMIVMLLVLIAGLILLGWGEEKTIHLHHWEYFNPPRDL